MSVAAGRWAPLAAVAFILADDLVLTARSWPVPVLALLDEPAHLVTAALLLAAVGALRATPPVIIALTAAVALDVDHLPLYAGAPMGAQGRPPTHSLTTIALLVLASVVARRRRRELLWCAVGVGLHLVRDIATGPGVPLVWPISSHAVAVPYATYAALVVVSGALAASRPTSLSTPS